MQSCECDCERAFCLFSQMVMMLLWLESSSTETLLLFYPSRGNTNSLLFYENCLPWNIFCCHKMAPPLKRLLLQCHFCLNVFYCNVLQRTHVKTHLTAISHMNNADCDLLSLCSNTTLVNSKVVTVIIKPTPALLSSPVEIEFPHLHNVSPE